MATDTHRHTCPFGLGPARDLCASECPREHCSGKPKGMTEAEARRFAADHGRLGVAAFPVEREDGTWGVVMTA